MKIRIVKENQEKIETALKAVNGNAVEYTLTSYAGIVYLADESLKKIYNALQNKASCKGAVLHYTSGSAVANSYKYSRKATYIAIKFNARLDAFLIKAEPSKIYKDGGKAWIDYTNDQKERIKELALQKAERF